MTTPSRRLEKPLDSTELAQKVKRENQIWLRLSQLFGARFIREHGKTPSESWCEIFAQLSDKQIRKGIQVLTDKGSEWCPTAPSFRAACLQWDGRYHQGVPESHQLEDQSAKERHAGNLAEFVRLRDAGAPQAEVDAAWQAVRA